MTQGKCVNCRIAYRWEGKPRLWDAACRYCKRPLKQTNYLLRWVWQSETPFFSSPYHPTTVGE